MEKSVNTTVVGDGDTASAGLGFQVPKTLEPGEYTVELLISSPNQTWDAFDWTSLPITVNENKQAEVDKADLSYESGVIQGYVTIENDGNVPLDDGELRLAVVNAETDERMAVNQPPIQEIPVGTSVRQTVNFNFSAEKNSTYYIGIRYDDGEVTDDAFTQIATAPRATMAVVDIDGPEEVVQGENATYTLIVKNNGDVKVDSTSLVARLQTGEGTTVAKEGIVVDVTYPGKTARTEVTFTVADPSLLGRSQVSVIGQASKGNNTTQMLPRDEGIFVSAPGFIISGDSSFSDLSPGESFTVTQTFLVVGRPGAQIDVRLQCTVCKVSDGSKLTLISGSINQTVTSGSSLSWTFLVKSPVSGKPVRIIAQSGSQIKAKDVAVSTVGRTGIIGNLDGQLPDSYDELFTNTYMATVFPGFTDTVYYLLQWLFALTLVAIIQFHDAFAELTALQQHGSALIAAAWTTGFSPEISVLLTGAFLVGLYIEHKYMTTG